MAKKTINITIEPDLHEAALEMAGDVPLSRWLCRLIEREIAGPASVADVAESRGFERAPGWVLPPAPPPTPARASTPRLTPDAGPRAPRDVTPLLDEKGRKL